MCLSNDDAAEVWCKRERTARKRHRCSECTRAIQPGERYVYLSGINDGDPFSDRLCLTCEFLWWALWQLVCGGDGGTMLIGGLDEELRNHAPFSEVADDPDIVLPEGEIIAGILRDTYQRTAELAALENHPKIPDGCEPRRANPHAT